MPILETTDKIAPRSALRHRPAAGAPESTDQNTPATSAAAPLVKRASRFRQPETGDEVTEWKRGENDDLKNKGAASLTTRRIPIASTVLPKTPLPAKPVIKKPARIHPLLYLGVGMLAMLALIAILSMVTNWFATTLDDLRYGRPRTFQIDAYVGHNESPGMPSHFLAINLHGRIEIIELPGGDASHARIYIGPQLYGSDADLIPVTLSFIDVNGDHKPDMIINFQGTQVVFINDQGGFRPLRPEERGPVEQFLQHHRQ